MVCRTVCSIFFFDMNADHYLFQISDSQQSMSLRPLRRAFLIPLALLVVADSNFSIRIRVGQVAATPVKLCEAKPWAAEMKLSKDLEIIFAFCLQKVHYRLF